MKFAQVKPAGCGIGLRPKHYPKILSEWPQIDWFEAISENFMDSGGRPIHVLEQIRSRYPVALHGVALSIGSVDPINKVYLRKLKELISRIDPFLVSDHLCWSGVDGKPLHDLLPLPFNEESLAHIVSRVTQVQEFIERPILLENVSSYVTYRHSTIPEWEFISEIARQSGCGILLDVNNVYVNAINHHFDPSEYIQKIPTHLIGQIHLAGHTNMGEFLFDTHGSPVIDPVWKLYEETLARHGQISTLIEWDENIPSFERLREEAELAKQIYNRHAKQSAIASSAEAKESKNLKNTSVIPLAEIESKIKARILPNHPDAELAFLNPQGSASGSERMAVYASGYPARMFEALKETYETVYRVLGHDTFSELSHAYSLQFPSSHYNLNYAGQYLAEFLKVLPDHIESQCPFLHDLAVLEWRCWLAFHAFDAKPFQPSELAKISPEDWERAKIIFQPSVSVVTLAWPVLDLWKVKHEENFSFDLSLMRNRPQTILVGRRGDVVRCEALNELQAQLITDLISGTCLGDACEELAEKNLGSEELPVARWFATWVQAGLIAACELPEIAKSE